MEYLNYREILTTLENNVSIVDSSAIYDIYSDWEYYLGENGQMRTLDIPHKVGINEFPILLNPWNGQRIIDNLSAINNQNMIF